MGYRNNTYQPNPEDMLPRFSVRNGATLRLAFHCYYLNWEKGHDPKYHDHMNWPSPTRQDQICQMQLPKDYPAIYGSNVEYITEEVTPINLSNEGYSQIKIAFDDSTLATYLTATANIESGDDGNIVRLKIATAVPTFTDKPKTTRFTVFAVNSNGHTDEIIHGILDILPGAIPV